eukprot:CAMPEP_0181237314 /NCGR_PEP_ID=MMETSP1096-20121128/38691_1 /TAXON_ID=156174 ORGANISM="Chrysochromulina ericina, Strain CCMP281" /NCGR_SAMPLE_ID=MMETSP1096 /ASSEMBLY_ACC=CAM_ASM_000453 /LENGTH=40 /DNA_ID= /DNA_START= /DNA_END= /DNA_ORIENTATION=
MPSWARHTRAWSEVASTATASGGRESAAPVAAWPQKTAPV